MLSTILRQYFGIMQTMSNDITILRYEGIFNTLKFYKRYHMLKILGFQNFYGKKLTIFSFI